MNVIISHATDNDKGLDNTSIRGVDMNIVAAKAPYSNRGTHHLVPTSQEKVGHSPDNVNITIAHVTDSDTDNASIYMSRGVNTDIVATQTSHINSVSYNSVLTAVERDVPTHHQHQYHRGDQQGVHNTPSQTEMSDKLRAELEKQKSATKALQDKVQHTELLQELEKEKQNQEAWEAALEKLQQAKAEQTKKHEERMAALRVVETTIPEDQSQLEWVKTKLAELGTNKGEETTLKKVEEVENAKATLQELVEQQKQIAARAAELVQITGNTSPEVQALLSANKRQDNSTEKGQLEMLEQLHKALAPREPTVSGDWQKDVLRQFLTSSNKTTVPGGATTLKPDLLRCLMDEGEDFCMAE